MSEYIYTLTVSIVIYCNNQNELIKAVNSVLNSRGVKLKLYIIDNSPTDNLRHLFNDSRIEYIFNNNNIGFGAAHNIALKRAKNESIYHLCLNPDIHFSTNVLKKIIEYMENHRQVGQLLPRIIDSNGHLPQKQRHLLPTPYITFFRGIFKNLSFTKKELYKYFTHFKSYDEEMSAPFLSGCFVFLRNSVVNEVGMFDERFFMYYEDVDLSRRIYTHSGNVYWPGVTITHVGHMDSHKNWRLTLIHIASAIKYYNKWGWFDNNRKKINAEILSLNQNVN